MAPRRLLKGLATLGPFALVFAIYSILLDHLPDPWFALREAKYITAASLALAAGFTARMLFSLHPLGSVLGDGDSGRVAEEVPPTASANEKAGSSAGKIFRQCKAQVTASLTKEPRGEQTFLGWGHYLSPHERPSSVGTTYIVRTLQVLGWCPEHVIPSELRESLSASRCVNGGWAARSQRGTGRPEVTSWVLPALKHLGASRGDLDSYVKELEEMLDESRDPAAMTSVSIVSSTVLSLVEVAPSSPKLLDLVEILLKARLQVEDDGGTSIAWGQDTRSLGQSATSKASPPHTAQATLALAAVARLPSMNVRASWNDVADVLSHTLKSAHRYLLRVTDLTLREDEIRRSTSDGTETIRISHFTPAWIAIALMEGASDGDTREKVDEVMKEALLYESKGLWYWPNRTYSPSWMTFQGVWALRNYCLYRTS